MGAKRGERRIQILQVLAHMLEEPTPEKITTAALAKKLDVSEAALYRHFASKAQMYEGLIEFVEETVFGLANKIIAEEDNGVVQARAIVSMLLAFAEKNPGMVRVLIGEALVNEHERLQMRVNQLLDRLEATIRQSLRVAATQRNEGSAEGAAPVAKEDVPTAREAFRAQEGHTAKEVLTAQESAPAAQESTPAARASMPTAQENPLAAKEQEHAADAQERMPAAIGHPPAARQETRGAHERAISAPVAHAPDPTAQANLMIAYVVGRWHQYAKSGFKRKPTDLWEKQWPLLV